LQIERILVDGGSNSLLNLVCIEPIEDWEADPVSFDGLLRLLKRIHRERDDLGT
jgi:hypothetical protein